MARMTKAEREAIQAQQAKDELATLQDSISRDLHAAALGIVELEQRIDETTVAAVSRALDADMATAVLAELDKWIPGDGATQKDKDNHSKVLSRFKNAFRVWCEKNPNKPKRTFGKPKGAKSHIVADVQKPKGRNAKAKDGAETETDSAKAGKAVKLTLHEAVKVLIESFGPEAVAREVALQIEKAEVISAAQAKAA